MLLRAGEGMGFSVVRVRFEAKTAHWDQGKRGWPASNAVQVHNQGSSLLAPRGVLIPIGGSAAWSGGVLP